MNKYDEFWKNQNSDKNTPDDLAKSLNPIRSLRFLKEMVANVDDY